MGGKFLRICFRGQKFPTFLVKYMKYISTLMFEDEPDYDYLRGILCEEIVNANSKLGGEVVTPEALPPDLLYGPSKKPPSERVSSIFDSACISATSYEKLREDKWAERSQDSLRNPTKAMLDIMKKMKAEKNQDASTKTPKGRKRTKSFSDVDNTNSTPAMMEVMRLKKLKSMDDANDELTNSETPVVALLKLPFKLSPVTITKEILEEGSDAFQPPTEIKRRKTSKNKELKRLENFNHDVLERRRTRSDAVAESTKTQREIRSNLRSAFNYGIAPVRNFMRSVSSSLPKIF